MALAAGSRLRCLLILVLAVSPSARAQSPVPRDPLFDRLQTLVDDFGRRVRSAGFDATVSSPAVLVDTPPQLSKHTRQDNTIHTSPWAELTPDVQSLFTRWAGYAGVTPGQQLFDDMFHRFFFVHELSHWLQIQAARDTDDVYARELEANRVTVAYWREEDPGYLDEAVAQFQRLNAALPDPVPAGQDAEGYFNANYRTLGSNPQAYGWFQTRMVIAAARERPVRTFADTVRRLALKSTNRPD